jgi:hypothetical protein
MSGAGSRKADYSTETELYEHKDANKTYGLTGADLLTIWTYAVREDKNPIMVIDFANGMTATIQVTRRAT